MPKKKITKKIHKWTIQVRGSIKRTSTTDYPRVDFWMIKKEYAVKSISVYPALRRVDVYVISLP